MNPDKFPFSQLVPSNSPFWGGRGGVVSRLGNVNRLARHQTPVNDKQKHNRVKLERGTREPDTAGEVIVDGARGDPVGHEGVEAQRGGDRGALKVLCLARRVLGDVGRGDVEAGEARQAAEDKEGEEDVVERGAQANGEGDDRRGEAKGDLTVFGLLAGGFFFPFILPHELGL